MVYISTIFYPPCQSLCTEPSEYDTVNGTNPGTSQHGGDRHWGGGEIDGHPVSFLYAMLLKHVGDSVNHLWQLSVMVEKLYTFLVISKPWIMYDKNLNGSLFIIKNMEAYELHIKIFWHINKIFIINFKFLVIKLKSQQIIIKELSINAT